jgi:hypothetical protein
MGNCDLCSTPLGTTGNQRYSSAQMQSAADAGLRPAGGPLEAMAAITGFPVDHEDWLRMVRSDTSDWIVCLACASRVNAHLK